MPDFMPQKVKRRSDGAEGFLTENGFVKAPSREAPGAPYLPDHYEAPGPSEEAYWGKYRDKQDAGYDAAGESLRDAREMEGLLERQRTGGLKRVPVVGGLLGAFDPETWRINQIGNSAARSMRKPGEGSMSDFDAKMFQQMSYNSKAPEMTNKALMLATRMASENTIGRREFMDWYVGKFGNRREADENWRAYTESNPIFDARSEALGTPILNSKRQTWRQFYGSVRGPQDAKPTPAMSDMQRTFYGDRPDLKPRTYSDRARNDLQMKTAKIYAGSTAEAGERANPYIVTSEAELRRIQAQASKLKKARYFIDDDGKVYTVGGGR